MGPAIHIGPDTAGSITIIIIAIGIDRQERTRPVQAEGLSRLIISRHGLNTPALACVRAVRNCSRGCETPKLQEGHLNACVACICPIVWVNSWRHFGHAIGHGSSLPYIASPEP